MSSTELEPLQALNASNVIGVTTLGKQISAIQQQLTNAVSVEDHQVLQSAIADLQTKQSDLLTKVSALESLVVSLCNN